MANGKPGLVSRLRHKASEVVLGLGCLGFFGGFLGVPAGLAADEVFHMPMTWGRL